MLARIILITALIASPALAQKKPEKMPEVWRKMNVPPAPALSPAEALKTFKVAPGFRIELVAAEPLIEDPVAVVWDGDGRLWVVEMRAYMQPDVFGKQEDAPICTVAVLEDSDGDGRYDKRTTFLDKLVMPRAIALVEGGVLIAEPPVLWYCRDTDGDLKCDEKVEVYKGYARQGPVEHTDNGLLPALDNWMYSAKSTKRFQFRLASGKPKLIEGEVPFKGQWGIAQDNYGRLYTNSNPSYLHVDLVPGHYLTRNADFKTTTGISVNIASEQAVYSIRVNPGINRGYQGPMLRSDGRLSRTTAACAPEIYRGDQFPPRYVGDAFVCEPAGNVVAHFHIDQADPKLRAQHVVYDDDKWGKREFLASRDERFRPVQCLTGPDGCLYVVDLYRGILQHKLYVTPFLRTQIIERGLDKPLGLGRIYRIVHEGKGRGPKPAMLGESSAKLVAHLSHPNGWWRDTAQRLLVQRRDVSVVPALAKLAMSGGGDPFADATATDGAADNHLGRLHALWTLEGLGKLDDTIIDAALGDRHVKVQAAAIRLSEVVLTRKLSDPRQVEEQTALLNHVLAMADDSRPDIAVQLAFSLSEIKAPLVGAALRRMLLLRGSDAMIRDAVVSGLGGRELEFLQRLLADPQWTSQGKSGAPVIADLTACIINERNPQRVGRLLGLIADESTATRWRQAVMLDAIIATAFPKGRQPKPIHYEQQPLAMLVLAKLADPAMRRRVEQVGKFITFGAAAAAPPPPTPLTPAQQARFNQGKELYLNTCAACHLASALGEEGKAPPLLDSPWLNGTPKRLVRIVLLGLGGPVTVHGREYNMDMPPLKGFNDEQIAAILTYARREWEHRADPVDPADVTAIRAQIGDRQTAWTIEELLKIK